MPASSNIKSDLDLLNLSGHEFPDDADNRRRSGSFFYGGSTRDDNNGIRWKMMEDGNLPSTAVGGGGGTASTGRSFDERDDIDGVSVGDIMNKDKDYLHDDNDDANITMGGEGGEMIGMSGL